LPENAIVPMNLSRGGRADYVITGSWSQKSAKEAHKYCEVHIAASNVADHHTTLPDYGRWQISDNAAYVHVCSNETIHGVEMHELPDLAALGTQAPLVIDCSSHIISRPIDWSRVGVAYAGAQKNIGPAGLTLVIVREDLLGHALPDHTLGVRLPDRGRQRLDVQHTCHVLLVSGWSGVPVDQASA
jgi:phosphoserine aminotransferase